MLKRIRTFGLVLFACFFLGASAATVRSNPPEATQKPPEAPKAPAPAMTPLEPLNEPERPQFDELEPVLVPADPPAVQSTGSCELVYSYDWPADIAYGICQHESGGDTYANNPSDNHFDWAGCYGSTGLFQINCSHGQVFDPVRNVEIAYSMYKASGNSFKLWTTCALVAGCW